MTVCLESDDRRVSGAVGELVSIIIPSFNRAAVLERAVESALQQTYRNTEIIVVDDGSTDDTKRRLQRLQAPNLRVVSTPQNGGPARARNLGIAHSRGSYVAFLDSDDIWEPWKLQAQLDCFHRGPAQLGAVYCGREVKLGDGSRLEIQPKERGDVFAALRRRNTVPLPTLMVKRSVLDAVGVFDPDMPACEDWDLVLRVTRHYACDYVPGAGVIYDGTGADRMSARARSVFIANHQIFRRFNHRQPDKSVLAAYLALQSRELLHLGHASLAARYALRALWLGGDGDERLALRTLRELLMRKRLGRFAVRLYSLRPKAGRTGQEQATVDHETSRRAARFSRLVEAVRDTVRAYLYWWRVERDSGRGGRRSAPADARSALVVAASLPPRFDGGVFRPLSWLQYAEENGWQISAVTRANDGTEGEAGRQLAEKIPAGVAVCRTEPLPLRPSQRVFQQVDGGFLTALAFYRAAAARFSASPPAVVVATGPSFAAFVAGFFLARRFRARLVLDYRDEWSENPFSFVENARDNRKWEQRCLKAADTVFFTTESQLQHAETAFGGVIDGKGQVLLNGWEPDPSVEATASKPYSDGTLTIAFSGVLGSMASPAPFLRDLEQVVDRKPALKDQLSLRFIGRRLPAAEEALDAFSYPELIERIDQVPRAEADRLIRQSDALLLLSNLDLKRYLQGKLFEYLASGKPILMHGPPGEAQALALRLGAGVQVADGEPQALAQAVRTLFRTSPDVWANSRRQQWARDHTRQRMAEVFFERLSSLTAVERAEGDR